jgi:uncharacterized protein
VRKLIFLLGLAVCSTMTFAESYQGESKMQLYVVLFEPGPSWVADEPMARQDLREHAQYHGQMIENGRSFAAGGFVGRDGGMAVFRAKDVQEAQDFIAADPAVRNGVFKAQLHQWRPKFVSKEPLVVFAF